MDTLPDTTAETVGDSAYRRLYQMPEPSDSFRRSWAEYHQKHAHKSRAQLGAELQALALDAA